MLGVGRLLKSYSYDLRIRSGGKHAVFLRRLAPDYAEYRRIMLAIIVLEQAGYIYMSNPKAGCTTIRNRLYELEGKQPLDDPLDIWKRNRAEFTLPLNFSKNRLKELIVTGDYFRFTFVRNPFDRLISGYEYVQGRIGRGITWNDKPALWKRSNDPRRDGKGHQLMDFASFIEDACYDHQFNQNKHWRPQYELLKPDLINYDFIGRFENFSDDLTFILQKLKADPAVLGRVGIRSNPSKRKKRFADYYDDRLADLVRTRYAHDFKYFGYSLDLPD